MSDERVERVKRAIEEAHLLTFEGDTMTTQDERDAFERVMGTPPNHCIRVGNGYTATEYNAWEAHNYIERWAGWKARAAIAALDEEPTLEDVLRGWAVLQLVGKRDGSAWNAYVEEASGDGRYADGTGTTVDAAIRAAVANAKDGA